MNSSQSTQSSQSKTLFSFRVNTQLRATLLWKISFVEIHRSLPRGVSFFQTAFSVLSVLPVVKKQLFLDHQFGPIDGIIEIQLVHTQV